MKKIFLFLSLFSLFYLNSKECKSSSGVLYSQEVCDACEKFCKIWEDGNTEIISDIGDLGTEDQADALVLQPVCKCKVKYKK